MKYYLKTKNQLAKLGIHSLQRTPGKLITAKGHIDGYLSAYGIVWGKLGMTGEQAQKATGFTPKKGAKGVLLARRKYIDKNGKLKNGIFASSLVPHDITPTKKYMNTPLLITALGKMGSKHLQELIYPVWEPLVTCKSKKPWDGYHYFVSRNAKKVTTALHWDKLEISKGNLTPSKEAPPNWFDSEKNQIHFLLPKFYKGIPFDVYQTGIVIFDFLRGDSFHISPQALAKLLFQTLQGSRTLYGCEKLPGNREHFIPPVNLYWKSENLPAYKYAPSNRRFPQKYLSPFFGYIYYKAPSKLPHLKFSNYRKLFSALRSDYLPYYPDFNIPYAEYSPSKSFRIKVAKNRTNSSHRFHLIINLS